MSIPTPFCGWRHGRFYLRTSSGYQECLSGPRITIVKTLRKLLPAWHRVAVEKEDEEITALIEKQMVALDLEVPS